ncbi:MAG: bifunctional folylpolyglutamate synthase/dihydrofolate synthase, partial [Armatimonadetes bacterium]|nr:bifunctional folylpolyglutamate synthase/dihydrofolate synthase [Armatimonadota bacterium]
VVYRLLLLGAHQVANAACALEAAEVLQGLGFPTTEEQRRSALAKTRHPGRMEVLGGRPIIVLDGAHNPAGMEALRAALDRFPAKRRILVLGILEDKDIQNMVRTIVSRDTVLVATQSRSPRAARTEEIAGAVDGTPLSLAEIPDVSKALDFAMGVAGQDDLICVTGSLTTVAEAREVLCV